MMRPAVLIIILAVLLAAIWAFDSFEYGGQYSATAWDTVKHEVENWTGSNDR